jgi:hypothetical protein
MSIPNAAILWPVRFLATSYLLRVTIGATTTNLAFPASGSLTVARDYWFSGDAQTDAGLDIDTATGRADLLGMLQATLRLHANGGAATVAFDAAGERIVVTFGGGQSGSILWSNVATTLDFNIFGWGNANTASATSTTATEPCAGRWLPGRPFSFDSLDRQPIVGGVARSISGKVRISRFSTPTQDREVQFQFLDQTKVIASSHTYEPFSYAWYNSLSLGRPFRVYDDVDELEVYSVYRTTSLEDPMQRNEQFRVWWDVSLRMAFQFGL